MDAAVETRNVITKVFKANSPLGYGTQGIAQHGDSIGALPASTRPRDLDAIRGLVLAPDPPDITLFVNGVSVFIGNQVVL